MSESNPVFNRRTDYSKQFKEKYAKTADLPMTKCLKVFFHPTIRDHIITVNEVNFPTVDSDKVHALFHNKIRDPFEEKIRDVYMTAAGRFEARRRVKVADNPNIRKSTEDSDSMPYEPSSSLWSDDEDSLYEGGQKDPLKIKKSLNKSRIRLTKSKSNKWRWKKNADPQKIKGDYPRVRTKKTQIKDFMKMSRKQQIFNRAVDMYMEDKNVYLAYKDYDEAIEPETNDETPNLYMDGTDRKIDEYWPERPSLYSSVLFLEYSSIPKYEGMNYIPPPFREKYEIGIWRLDTNGISKIKSSYFTPELVDYDSPEFNGFDISLGLDHQTMIMVENTSKKNTPASGERISTKVLLFDIYTLDKIVEFGVDTVNSNFLSLEDYNHEIDTINPQFSNICATDEHFPKITCWNEGKYVLACVGATQASKVYHEFRIYDSTTMTLLSEFRRRHHDSMSFLMLDVFFNPKDSDSLMFIMKEGNSYAIIEVDLINNTTRDKCRFVVNNLNFIKLAEDLSQVFIVKNDETNTY